MLGLNDGGWEMTRMGCTVVHHEALEDKSGHLSVHWSGTWSICMCVCVCL